MALPQISGEFRCVSDVNLRYTPGGKAVADFRAVADSKKKNKQTDEWEDDKIVWVRVVVWERLAEHVAESVVKGDPVVITGRVHGDEWETKEGEKRVTFEIIADAVALNLKFAPGKVERSNRQGGGSSQGSRQQSNQQTAPADDPWASPDEPPF